MIKFLAVAAEHCRKAEHYPLLSAGSFERVGSAESEVCQEHRWTRILFLIFLGAALLASGCSKRMETDLFIPIRLEGLPEGMILAGSQIKGIEIRVRASKFQIESLMSGRLQYPLDMKFARLGTLFVPVDPTRIQLPRGISIVGFSPQTLTLEVTREVRKTLPIAVTLIGEPAPGYQVRQAETKPSVVVIRGPEEAMAVLEKVATKPIDVTNVTTSFQKEIALEIPESLVMDGPSQIIATRIEIGEKVITRQLNGVPIVGKGNPYRYRIVPPVIDIELGGPVRLLDALKKKGAIEVFMDLTALKPGVYPRRAVLTLPPEITLVATKPEIFTVTIFKHIEEEE